MPFPFILHENFEAGTQGVFTSEVDTTGRLDFPDHNDGLEIKPWRGGYVMRGDLDRGTTEAYVEENTLLNMTTGENRFLIFHLRTNPHFQMPPGKNVKILSMLSAGDVEEVAFGISRTDSQVKAPRMSIWSPDDTTWVDGLDFPIGKWFAIRIAIFHHATLGRAYLHVGNNTIQVNRMAFQSFTKFRLGMTSQSADVRGTLYFDDLIIDTAQFEEPGYVDPEKLSGESVPFFKSSYAFVGPGRLRGATLLARSTGGVNDEVLFYDTDRLPLVRHDLKGALKCSTAESKDSLIEGIDFHRGCYMAMSGTQPQVIVHYGPIGQAAAEPGLQPEDILSEAL